jgi:hypothetical protein
MIDKSRQSSAQQQGTIGARYANSQGHRTINPLTICYLCSHIFGTTADPQPYLAEQKAQSTAIDKTPVHPPAHPNSVVGQPNPVTKCCVSRIEPFGPEVRFSGKNRTSQPRPQFPNPRSPTRQFDGAKRSRTDAQRSRSSWASNARPSAIAAR